MLYFTFFRLNAVMIPHNIDTTQSLRHDREKQELLGKIEEAYHKAGIEVPIGLPAASVAALRTNLEHARRLSKSPHGVFS